VLNKQGSRAYCLLTQHVQPRFWPKSFSWGMLVVLDLAVSPSGLKHIALQEVSILPGGLLRTVPLLGPLAAGPGNCAVALGIRAGVWAARTAYRSLYDTYAALVVAAGGDAGPPPGLAHKRTPSREAAQRLRSTQAANPGQAVSPGMAAPLAVRS
jgi:hypothetical protein